VACALWRAGNEACGPETAFEAACYLRMKSLVPTMKSFSDTATVQCRARKLANPERDYRRRSGACIAGPDFTVSNSLHRLLDDVGGPQPDVVVFTMRLLCTSFTPEHDERYVCQREFLHLPIVRGPVRRVPSQRLDVKWP